ncbi:hypothetical protein EPN95_03135 [Patescibacteria group bacterium]|nr:MAG: hypothetical protein EPN95_03135 [Patescibacteria group bacterium]
MSENLERSESSPEVKIGSPETAIERQEQLADKQERSVESPRDADAAERARVEALETAISVEAGGKEKDRKAEPTTAKRRGPISKKQKEASFKRQMKEIQAQEPPLNRAFSKVIHNKAVEKTSDVVGSTVARPNAILAGAVSAFALTLAVYVTAKIIGFQLSGFETIAAFIIGWIIGLIYDYLRVVITGQK